MIKEIVFDLGGVLVPEKGDFVKSKVAELINVDSSEFEKLLSDFKEDLTSGKIKLLDMYSEILRNLKKDFLAQELVKSHLEYYEKSSTDWDKEMLKIIEKLKNNFRVSCLTNTEIEIAEFNKERGLFDYFDNVFISTDMGYLKPHTEIYNKVVEDLRCEPDEILFIDDNLEYVRGAEDIGINALLYKNVGQLKKDLKNFLGVNL